MGYKGNFESYKNLSKDYSDRFNSNKLSYWNSLKNSGVGFQNTYSNNKGFIRRLLNFIKYGRLGKDII